MTAAAVASPPVNSTLLDDPTDVARRDLIRRTHPRLCRYCPRCGTGALLLMGVRSLGDRELPTTAERGNCGATPPIHQVLSRGRGRGGRS